MIFSRWPIVNSDQIKYTECGPSSQDCLSNKVVKYAEIKKLAKRYHMFGTHMDAGGDQQDTEARRSQIGEIRQFIDAKQIPDEEPVIFGGDFNIDPLDSDSLYYEFIDSLNPVVPEPIGFYESSFSEDTGKIIAHVWSDSRHLLPKKATNNLVTFRSIKDTMWELSEFSDHRAAQGRFVFPAITKSGADTTICKGESLSMALNTNHNADYQWQRNGQQLTGESNASYIVQNAKISDTGDYSCVVDYQQTYGTINNNIVKYIYPNGSKTFQANVTLQFGRMANCTGGISNSVPASIY